MLAALDQLIDRAPIAPQAVRFILTGVLASVVHVGVFSALVRLGGLYPVLATTVGFLVAFLVSFTLQKYWTFGERSRAQRTRQALQFFALQVTNLTLNALLVYVGVVRLGLWEEGAQVAILGVLALSTYLISRTIFRAPAEPEPTGEADTPTTS
ncbi:hypothetical protein GVX82_00690 [Patescibacteria group bacterium]|jgi:putative flippase GtrA|nr:hypothetical protein [Patescibacteria group bacterium]